MDKDGGKIQHRQRYQEFQSLHKTLHETEEENIQAKIYIQIKAFRALKLNGHLDGFPSFKKWTRANISLFHSFQQLSILSQMNYLQANVTHSGEWFHFPKLLSNLWILKLPKKETWKNDSLEVGKKHELFQSSSLWYSEIFLLKCLHLTFFKLQSFQLLAFTIFMLKFSWFILIVFYQGEKPKMNRGKKRKRKYYCRF